MSKGKRLIALLVLSLTACSQPAPHPSVDIRAAVATAPVSDDPDDPAIWVHPSDPAQSLIIGTNKVAAPRGALVVFGLDGKIRQTIAGLDRPNNVDVEYGLMVGGKPTDIAVTTERLQHRLRIYRIWERGRPARPGAAETAALPGGGSLVDISSGGGAPVLDGETGERAEPMGIALYRRPRDGAVFAIISPKAGPRDGYLWQYRLQDDGAGRVKATKVRRFGTFSGLKEIEAIAVDDALGYVYYGDEGNGIHKWHADPDHPQAARELAHFGRTEFAADQEGIAIYARGDGTGYIVCTDQIDGNSHYHIYRREGGPGGPHDHAAMLKCVRGGADSTDGIEVTSAPLGPVFPNGLLVVMNSGPRNFLLYRWEDVALTGAPKLASTAK
jgi:3-phytase